MSGLQPTMYDFWMYLPSTAKLFSVFFLGVIISVFFACARILHSLCPVKPTTPVGSVVGTPTLLARSLHRLSGVRQLLNFTLFLLLAVFFMTMPHQITTIQDSSTPADQQVIEQVVELLAFAGLVSLCLLVLHSIQWFTSARVNSFARQRESS